MELVMLLNSEGISLDDVLEAVAHENAVPCPYKNANTGFFEDHSYYFELIVKNGLLGSRTEFISFNREFIDYKEALNLVRQFRMLRSVS